MAVVLVVSLLGLVAAACSSSGSRAPTATTASTPATASASPPPAKPNAVGVVSETFVDTHHGTDANGACLTLPSRTLVTTIWYPATAPTASATPQSGATPARSGGPYPLIVFAHGYSATPQLYEGLLSQWAAAGFVVAAPVFPLSSSKSPCGPVAGDSVNQPPDMSYVVTSVLALSAGTAGPLAGLVDPEEIGAAGHSDGAITTVGLVANTCCHDARIKAAAILAGTAEAYPGGKYDFTLAPPLLVVHGSDDALVPYEGGVAIFNQAQGPKGLLTVTGGDHGSAASPTDVARATIDFFDAYLRGDEAALARLPGDGQPGLSTMRLFANPGSTETIPTLPPPKLQLHASASPTTGLTNGQVVTVTWSGFTAGKVINILECSDRRLTNFCDYTHSDLLKPDPTGAGSLPLQIVEGKVGSGTCDAAHPGCLILVNNASSTDTADDVIISIAFAS